MAESLALRDRGPMDATERDRSAIDVAFDALITEVLLIHARAPWLSDYIQLQARQFSSWTEAFQVDTRQSAEESAQQAGSALSARNPPRWRPATLDRECDDPISIQRKSPASLVFSEDVAHSSVVARTGPDVADARITREATCASKISAGGHTSTRLPPVSETPGGAQKTSENTLESMSSTCRTLDAARYEGDAPDANPRNGDEDHTDHARGSSSVDTTRTSHEESEKHDHERGKEGEEDESNEQDKEDESEKEKGDGGEDDEEEEEDAQVEPVSTRPETQKQDEGHTISGRVPEKIMSQSGVPIGATDDEAMDKESEAEHDIGDSTDAADCGNSSLPTAAEQQNECSNRAPRGDEGLKAQIGQSVAGLVGDEIVLAQGLTHVQRRNGRATNFSTGTAKASEHVDDDDDDDDDDGSTSRDDSSLGNGIESDSNSTDHDTPINELDTTLRIARGSVKRGSTAVSDAVKTPTKRLKTSSVPNKGLVIKNVPDRLISGVIGLDRYWMDWIRMDFGWIGSVLPSLLDGLDQCPNIQLDPIA